MSETLIDRLDLFVRLRQACQQAGGQRAWAAMHGLSEAYVSDCLHARREPGDKILGALGLRRIVRYAEVRSDG